MSMARRGYPFFITGIPEQKNIPITRLAHLCSFICFAFLLKMRATQEL
jgi:hypothetical protein